MILDYSSYIKTKGSSGIVNYETVDNKIELFKHDSICPFCKKKIEDVVYSKNQTQYPDWLWGSFSEYETVIQCQICGWWEYIYKNSSDAILDGIRASDIEIYSSILEEYEDYSENVPVISLRDYIEKNPDKIYGISAHKMEELVRSVFKVYNHNCEVISFGKTRDGGKDGLIIFENNDRYLLQVKRRINPSATEGVDAIRSLIGVSAIEDETPKGCIFVSTADHFSSEAIKTAKKAVEKRVVDSFDLYNCKEFLELMELTKPSMPTVWELFLKIK